MKAVAALIVFLAGSVVCDANTRDEIERQYKRWARAALVNDADTILSILTPDYTLHTYTGSVIPRKNYEASLRKRRAANKPATVYATSMAAIAVTGGKAVVTSDETSDNVSGDPITKKRVKLVHVHRYLDTWIRIHGVWRLQTTITTEESTKVVPF